MASSEKKLSPLCRGEVSPLQAKFFLEVDKVTKLRYALPNAYGLKDTYVV